MIADLRTPEQWLQDSEFKGIEILDPDGWDRRGGYWEQSWGESITREEMWIRTNKSTLSVRLESLPLGDMPHDPSTCPRCCWAAKREGWEHIAPPFGPKIWVNDRLGRKKSFMPPFCPSLDAVAGLRQEMQDDAPWAHRWVPIRRVWRYASLVRNRHVFDSPEDLPAACVIEAAMRVLNKKESDD